MKGWGVGENVASSCNGYWHEKMCRDFMMPDERQGIRKFLTDEQIANLPAYDDGYSWSFEWYLRLVNPDAQNLVNLMLDDVCVEWMKGFKRKPSINSQQKFLDCASVIMTNLLRAHCNSRRTIIGIYRSKGALDRERRYRPAYMTADRFIAVQDWLIKAGHMEILKGGFNLPGYSQTTRVALTQSTAVELETDNLSRVDFKVDRGEETIRLKDKEGRLCGYDDTLETSTMRARLKAINTRLETADISTTCALSIHDRKPEYHGRNVRLHRVFTRGDFDRGGRFYGGWWQNIRKHARPKITIDGQHTIEADFRGFNPSVLLAEVGQPIPDDPYSSIVGANAPDDLREHAKATLAAFLNSKTGRTEEPKDFNSAKHGMSTEDFRQRVLDAFPMVRGLLGTSKGMKLQRQESDLAEAIMLHFVRQGHPILPIHDAFIVQARLEDELVAVMKGEFRAMFGQMPHVKVIRAYALR